MSTGVTIERTSIRATPGGEVIKTIGVGANLVFEIEIGSWYRMVSLEGTAQGGYVNSRSVKVTSVAPPPPVPEPVNPTLDITINSDLPASVYGDGVLIGKYKVVRITATDPAITA